MSSSESDITNGSAGHDTARLLLTMDSEVQRDGRVLDLTDDAWREDRLPYEDVTIPLSELPEAEQDNGGSTESVKEQEMKWSDLALQSLHENTPNIGT
ncbi:anaphase-promoting complex subunit 13 [Pseudorasbora parva]